MEQIVLGIQLIFSIIWPLQVTSKQGGRVTTCLSLQSILFNCRGIVTLVAMIFVLSRLCRVLNVSNDDNIRV